MLEFLAQDANKLKTNLSSVLDNLSKDKETKYKLFSMENEEEHQKHVKNLHAIVDQAHKAAEEYKNIAKESVLSSFIDKVQNVVGSRKAPVTRARREAVLDRPEVLGVASAEVKQQVSLVTPAPTEEMAVLCAKAYPTINNHLMLAFAGSREVNEEEFKLICKEIEQLLIKPTIVTFEITLLTLIARDPNLKMAASHFPMLEKIYLELKKRCYRKFNS